MQIVIPNLGTPLNLGVPLGAAPPIRLSDTLYYKGEWEQFETPMPIGYGLNGQPFIVTDRFSRWIDSSKRTAIIGDFWGNGAMWEPQLVGNASQGVDGVLGAVTGSQRAAIMAYNHDLNVAPGAGAPFQIVPGMCGRLVHTVRKFGMTGPDGTWRVFQKRMFINLVPEPPPPGAICPIFDGAGDVQWVTRAMVRKSVLRGCGYVPGQMTLAAAKAAGYVPDTDLAFFLDNGERRRLWLADDVWATGYSTQYGNSTGRLLGAMHAVGAAGVEDADFYALLTFGSYGIENARRGNPMRGGAGQNLAMKPIAVTLAMATRDPRICADALTLEGNETHQHFWVTSDFVGVPPSHPGGSGQGFHNRWPFQDVHVGRAHFFHGDQALPPNPLADPTRLDSDLLVRYEGTSGQTGIMGFNNMGLLKDGPDGVDGLTFLLKGGAMGPENPYSASHAYWQRYRYLNPDLTTSTELLNVDAALYDLMRDVSDVPVWTTTPDAFCPPLNQNKYMQATAGGFTLDFTNAKQAAEPVTRLDLRYSLDQGRSFLNDPNVSHPTYARSDFPRQVPVFVQNRRWSASGAGPWSVNTPKAMVAGSMGAWRFVITATGTASGAPVNVQPPQISQRMFADFPGDLYKLADTAVPPGTTLYAGLGWWNGNLLVGGDFHWTVEGVQVSVDDVYVTLPGDASIELVVTIGGVAVPASNVVNNIPLAFTSPASGTVFENVKLSHQLTATRPATYAIRSVAQNGASVDAAQFELVGDILRWAGDGTKDYEAPGDANANNSYVVVVRATNAFTGQTVDQTITYDVTDVVEGAATHYPFDGAALTDLGAVPGWTRESPQARLVLTGTGFVRRIATNSALGNAHFYREGVNTSATQHAGFTFTTSGTTAPGIVLFGMWIDGKMNGYVVYPANATTFAVRKFVAGVGVSIGTVSVGSIAAAFEAEADDTGSATEIRIFESGGTQIGAAIIDTAGTRRASGYNGLYLEGSATSSASLGDDFRGNMQF